MQQRIVLASNNAGKLREFAQMFAPLELELVTQASLGIAEVPEIHHTFIENALLKARHAARMSGLPALADDSGLCVPALGGAPGVHSARYAGTHGNDAANNAKLVSALAELSDRSAYYYCVLVFLRHADDPQPVIAEGHWAGEIIETATGANGFGYDPHFYLPERGLTAAALSAEEKNRCSHRAQALQALIAIMKA